MGEIKDFLWCVYLFLMLTKITRFFIFYKNYSVLKKKFFADFHLLLYLRGLIKNNLK